MTTIRSIDIKTHLVSTLSSGLFLVQENRELQARKITKGLDSRTSQVNFALNDDKNIVLAKTDPNHLVAYSLKPSTKFLARGKTDSVICNIIKHKDNIFLVVCKWDVYFAEIKENFNFRKIIVEESHVYCVTCNL